MSASRLVSNVPVPDPSLLTTEQLRRELAALRDSLEMRLNAMDKATELLNANVTRVPTDTDKQISHLKELHDEKFISIEKQFAERDVRSMASEDAAKVAVNAALQAQKEAAAAQNESNAAAITKSENATLKQIDGILALLASNNNALNDKITVINGRLDRGEGKSVGASGNMAMVIAGIAVLGTLFSIGFGVINATRIGASSGTVLAPPVTVGAPSRP